MDDFEGDVARHLDGRVADWWPEPGVLRARTGSPALLVAVVLLLALALGGGGLAWGLSSGTAGHGKAVSLGPAPDSPSPSCDPTGPSFVLCGQGDTSPCPVATPRARHAFIDCVVTDPQINPSCSGGALPCAPTPGAVAGCMRPEAGCPTSPPATSTSPSPAESGSVALPTCVTGDLQVDLVLGDPQRHVKDSIAVTATVTATRACTTTDTGSFAAFLRDSQKAAAWNHGGFRGPVLRWARGQVRTVTATWKALSDPDTYTVVFDEDGARGSKDVALSAPVCAVADIGATITADKSGYTAGDTATVTVTLTNRSHESCTIYGPDHRDFVTATASDGTLWWDGCHTGPANPTEPTCSLSAEGILWPALPPGGTSSQPYSWVLDKTAVPPGDYLMQWDHLGVDPKVTIHVTG